VGVFLPFDEKINPAEHRDRGRIESALNRPFHGALDEEFYPLLSQKAAALFHSMVCNHCFINGNKRTAVLALDMFLMVNQHILAMPPDQVYEMAKQTAQGNQNKIPNDALIARLTEQIGANMVDVSLFAQPEMQERLGAQYEKVNQHIVRCVAFGVKAIESFMGKPWGEVAKDYPDKDVV
jgi:death-on-curing family protein